jgi:hypothetical protein
MLKPMAALAALSLAAPAAAPASSPPSSPSSRARDEALRCWLMTHPNPAPLPIDHWPALNRGRSRFS